MDNCAVGSYEILISLLKTEAEKKKYKKIKNLLMCTIQFILKQQNEISSLCDELAKVRIDNIENKIPIDVIN